MTKLQRNHREEMLRVLRLLTSREEQLRYQRAVPYVPVTTELFSQWDACYGPRHHAWFVEAHSTTELTAIDAFERVVKSVGSELPERLPHIDHFVTMPEWERLASGAASALCVLESSHETNDAEQTGSS